MRKHLASQLKDKNIDIIWPDQSLLYMAPTGNNIMLIL